MQFRTTLHAMIDHVGPCRCRNLWSARLTTEEILHRKQRTLPQPRNGIPSLYIVLSYPPESCSWNLRRRLQHHLLGWAPCPAAESYRRSSTAGPPSRCTCCSDRSARFWSEPCTCRPGHPLHTSCTQREVLAISCERWAALWRRKLDLPRAASECCSPTEELEQEERAELLQSSFFG